MRRTAVGGVATILGVLALASGCATSPAEEGDFASGALATPDDPSMYTPGQTFTLDLDRLGAVHLEGTHLVPDGASMKYTIPSDPYEKGAELVEVSSVFVFANGDLALLGPLVRYQQVGRYLASYCEPSVLASGATPQLEGRVTFTITTMTQTPFPSFEALVTRLSARARADDGAKWNLDCVVASTPPSPTSAKPAGLERADLAGVFGDVLVR